MPIILGMLIAPLLYFPIWLAMISFEHSPWLGVLVGAVEIFLIVLVVKLVKNKLRKIDQDFENKAGITEEKEDGFARLFNVTNEYESIQSKIKSQKQSDIEEVEAELRSIFLSIPSLIGHESDGRETEYTPEISEHLRSSRQVFDTWANECVAKMFILVNHGYAPTLYADITRFKIDSWFIRISPYRPRGMLFSEQVPTSEFANEFCEWANKKFDEFGRWAYIEYDESDGTFLVHKKYGAEWYRKQKNKVKEEQKPRDENW